MTDQLISFETAKLAKEKGFDGKCFYWIHKKDWVFKERTFPGINKYYQDGPVFYNWNDRPSALSVPTQSLLQKWLREKHSKHILIDDSNGVLDQQHFRFQISELHKNHIYKTSSSAFNFENSKVGMYKTYEEALEQGLIEALKLIN